MVSDMADYDVPEVTQYAGLTTADPVAAIYKINITDPVRIYFYPRDYTKVVEGDIINITQTDRVQGRGLYENGIFKLGSPSEENFNFILLKDDEPIVSDSGFVVTGGFARVIAHEEPVVLPRKTVAKTTTTTTKS
jgi:hypothetical protein